MLGNRFEEVIEAVSRINKRPVVPALSSPTERAQCTPEQAYTWSKGEAIYAAGVQFPPVHLNGQTFLPGQANNYYIFPAVGLAIFATQASRVTDEMFIEAATGVADQVAPDLLKQGLLYPLLADILETEIQTAARVASWCSTGDWLACHVPLIWSRAFVATSTSPYTPKILRRRKQRDAGCRNALVVFDSIRLRRPAR